MPRYIKMPENLKAWKISSLVSEENGNEVYKVSKKEYDGTVVSANLRYICISGNTYNSDNVDFINQESSFLKNISQSGNSFNYIDVSVKNNPAKEKIELYIITEDLKALSDVMKEKTFTESEIIDFGIQMSSILEKLESNNIFHGNISPDNIFVTNDGKYKIGGFSDFESKISDMSFVAPEIANKQNADLTTDIYSLGLIMYSMCSNNRLPFESDTVSKEDAIKTRFDGKSVSAPQNGGEKLKSVIVIACQPDNANRWKNAANIKNALTSIRDENTASRQNPKVIVPETTDFDDNVFEEFEYEEPENSVSDENSESDDNTDSKADYLTAPAALAASEITSEVLKSSNQETVAEIPENKADSNEDVQSDSFEVTEPSKVISENENNILSDSHEDISSFSEQSNKSEDNSSNAVSDDNNADDLEIDNRVFDNYEIKNKVISFNKPVSEKDYGDYFDDPEPADNDNDNKPEDTKSDIEENDDSNPFGVFSTADDMSSDEKSKKNIVIIIISVIVMFAALGFIAYCIISGISGNNDNTATTSSQTTTVETTAKATTQPTTAAPTTQPTTAAVKKAVIPVVGYGYSYAKELLEADGFVVEIGEYKYSNDYDEGYVISQSPQGDSEADNGSVVTLDISLGAEEPETTEAPATEAPTEPENSAVDSSYLFANSDSAYLSKSDVSSLSREELNLAINEIYARRGRIFSDPYLSSYFKSKMWYNPKYNADEFSANVTFNSYEQANLQLMVNEQSEKGYR